MPTIRHLIWTLGLVAAVGAVIGLNGRGLFNRHAQPEVPTAQLLREASPHTVIIGNSLVKEGVDAKIVSRVTEEKTETLWAVGSGSAWWYLALKNAVLPSTNAVRLVVVVFRNDALTDPFIGVHGNFKKALDEMATSHEPQLDRLAYLNQMNTAELALTRFFPPYRLANDSRVFLEKVTHTLASSLIPEYGKYDVDFSVENVFADGNMVSEMVTLKQLEAGKSEGAIDFGKSIDDSFLPLMIALAQNASIKILFARYKNRSIAEGHVDSEMMMRYQVALRDYIESEGMLYHDFTENPQIGLHHYAFGNHFNHAGNVLFSRLLGERICVELNRESTGEQVSDAGSQH